MGSITNKARQYFARKIYSHLDGELKLVTDALPSEDELALMALAKMDETYPGYHFADLYAQAKQAQEEEKAAEKRRIALSEKIAESLNKANLNHFYRCDARSLTAVASEKFKDAVIAENFPAQKAELDRIAKLREQVEGAVYFATTDAKLMANLTALLERFGGELEDELKAVIGL